MIGKIDWLWLVAGIVLALVIHKCMTHPKSPLSGVIGTKLSY